MYKCFVTPRQYSPKKTVRALTSSIDTFVFEQARYHSFLGGDEADKVAKILNLPNTSKLPQGFWILSSKKRKEALKLGIEELPVPTQEEIDSLKPERGDTDDK